MTNEYTDSGVLPMVSIKCLVYNHAPYLRQCLDGFVMQKTNFRFEAIVHDDCSTDGSQEIIKEYAAKYPDIIKPIFETENQFSKHDGSLRRAIDPHLMGKYIAFCEGDDYWTDPNKLQMQVDYLEAHQDIGMCFTNFDIKHEENGLIEKAVLTTLPEKFPHKYNLQKWITQPGYIGPMTWLIQKKLYKGIPNIPTSDGTYICVAHFIYSGPIHCMIDKNTAVYRSNIGSITQSKSFKTQYWQKLNLCYAKIALAEYYYPQSSFLQKVKKQAYNSFFNNTYAKKIICYGNSKDITLLRQNKKNLSITNNLLLSICRMPLIRNYFKAIYLYIIQKRTGLTV